MKAITIWQPWASLIMGTCTLSEEAIEEALWLPKDVENRTWQTNYRGELLIHAGKRVERDSMYLVNEVSLPTGVILGVVDVVGMNMFSCSEWAVPDMWHWELDSPRAFAEPIPYVGKQGLFEVSGGVVAEAIKALPPIWKVMVYGEGLCHYLDKTGPCFIYEKNGIYDVVENTGTNEGFRAIKRGMTILAEAKAMVEESNLTSKGLAPCSN